MLATDPYDAAAANNLALANLYSCDLSKAMRSLEAAFARAPAPMLQVCEGG